MHLRINIDSGVPIYLQIAEQIRQIALAGGIGSGEKLPSVRSLAVKLRVNPNTVQAAYRQLESEGIVKTRKGLGVFLSSSLMKMPHRERISAMTSTLDQAVLKAYQLDLDSKQVLRLFEERLRAFRSRMASGDRKGEQRQ